MKKRPELLATLIYVTAGTLWIVFSDLLVGYITSSSTTFTAEDLQLVKGLFYIAITGVLVYYLVRSSTQAVKRLNSELEQRVAHRTAKLSDIYNRAPCGYHTLDREGRVVRINDRELEWLGYSRDEILGTRFQDHIETESLTVFEKHFEEFQRTGEVHNLELMLRRCDGTRFPVLLSTSAVRDESGIIVKSRSNLFDMTELLAARNRIEKLNLELQIRNRDLAAFSYSISHDLRAPVRAVTGFAEIMSSRHGPGLPEEARHYLDNILSAGRRMDRLINDLLRYAHLGTANLELQELQIDHVIAEISDEFVPTLKKLAGSLSWEAGEVRVMAERSLLEQILSNLIRNAIHYRSPDRPPEISVMARKVDGLIEITVADNGIGIAPEHHERIFALFQRLQNDDHDGTGIGLALAKRAAQLLGGSLTVRSTPGTGSTFLVTLQEAVS
jgi:PAS domain S-box-containing protein